MSSICEPDTKFRTSVVKPRNFAVSTLCDGHCVAFCIMGQLKTLFDPKVHLSILRYPIDRFGFHRRNDVIVATSDEYAEWPYIGTGLPHPERQKWDKGAPTAAFSDEQCTAWHLFPLVAVLHDAAVGLNWLGVQDVKEKMYVTTVEHLEMKYSQPYDWIVRTRPDFHWTSMPFNTAMGHKFVRYNDRLQIFARGLFHERSLIRGLNWENVNASEAILYVP